LIGVMVLGGVLAGFPRHAGAADATVVVRSGAAWMQTSLGSVRALRDAGMVRQHYDYSCGAASLATVLAYGLNDPVDEDGLMRDLLGPLTPDELIELQKKGLSLSDLQRLAQARGHKAQGFRVDRDQLAKLSRPVIVFVKPGGYAHFVVFKGLRGDRVHLADPSLGNVRMPLYRFLDMWADESGRGVIFAVERQDSQWPEHYALQLANPAGPPLELLSAERLLEVGRPFPSLVPNR
jgi:predicted double-glycine peptidase